MNCTNVLPPPSNLLIIRHKENKRQGGARNTGIDKATGNYILFLDHDDELVQGSLCKLIDELEAHPGLDILFFDYEAKQDDGIFPNTSFRKTPSVVMKGLEFYSHYQRPWTPWQFAYRRDFLNENNLRQIEGHMFEDADFVLKCTLAAKTIKYVPITALRYYLTSSQTTKITKEQTGKIDDLFYLNSRIKDIAIDWADNPQISKLIWGQYYFRQKALIMRYLWRFNFSTIRYILSKYRTDISSPGLLLETTAKYPVFSSYFIFAMKPVLPLIRKLVLMRR